MASMSTATAHGPTVHRGGVTPDWASLIVDVPNARYEPLFVAQRETYPNVDVAGDVSYDSDPLNMFDIFVPQPALRVDC